MPCALELLEYVDVLIDGPFVQELRSLTHPFVGSTNQRIIERKDIIDFLKHIEAEKISSAL